MSMYELLARTLVAGLDDIDALNWKLNDEGVDVTPYLRPARKALINYLATADPAQAVARADAYQNVRFAANGSSVCRGMVRSMPGFPRRITNLSTGTEFFVEADTVLDSLELVDKFEEGEW
jgi:hypothetical protein